jgi:nucleotide-binding universal stress UspA family protein
MKIKPNRSPGGVVVELGPNERKMPGVAAKSGLATAAAMRLKRILVPIDFSPCSRKALQYAVAFAKQFDAKISLIYVEQACYLAPEMGPVDLGPAESQAREGATEELSALAAKEVPSGVAVDVFVRQGHPPTEVINAASELDADLIIISTHGYTGLKHVWYGSSTETVVRHARCPVLVVREGEHEFLS